MSNASRIGPAEGGQRRIAVVSVPRARALNWAGGVALAAEAATVLALTNGLSLPVTAWQSYEFGEVVYIVLSVGAGSMLAWLAFANVLRT